MVESRCGAVGLGPAYPLPALSFAGASIAEPCLRFHTPLVEPDVRVSRIRLSFKMSCLRVGQVSPSVWQHIQAQLPVEELVGVSAVPRASLLMLLD